MAQSQSVDALRTRLPSAVFGGDLLETLSTTLRGLLSASGEQRAAASESARSRTAGRVTPASSVARRHLESAAGGAISRHSATPLPLIGALAVRPSNSEANLDEKHTRVSFDAVPAESGSGIARAVTFRPEHAGNTDFTWPDSNAERAPRSSAQPMTTSLLGRRVSEYLTLARADAKRRQATDQRDAPASRTEAVPPPAASPRHRLAWPDHLSEAALKTLQEFDPAHARMPVPIDRDRTWLPRTDASDTSRPRRADDDTVPGHHSIRDLSMQMAEVLRRQAVRHGIDLT
jgi:hypothetical protein